MSRSLVVLLSLLFVPLALADVGLNVSAAGGDPGAASSLTAGVFNFNPSAIQNLELRLPLPTGSQLTRIAADEGWKCDGMGPELVCTRASLAPTTGRYSMVTAFLLLPPDRNGTDFRGVATLRFDSWEGLGQTRTAHYRVLTFRMLSVFSSADSGEGSLRAAIEDANARCNGEHPCKVTFDLPRYTTIEPLTPLPPITGCWIEFRGDRTRDGDRAVELSGARLERGSGLEIRSQCAATMPNISISGLAINRFHDYGLLVTQSAPFQHYEHWGLFVGTDVTGTIARPNGRGVGVFAENAYVGFNSSIISGNRHSGVFAWQARGLGVWKSLVGVAANGAPLGNGASGLFGAMTSIGVSETEVAYNAHFGVALAHAARGSAVHHRSSIHDNGILGIDWGLDGPTPAQGEKFPSRPTITDAWFDPATNITWVTGTIPRGGTIGEYNRVDIYSSRALNSHGHAEGEVFANSTFFVDRQTDGSFTFRARVDGRLPHPIVSATLSSGIYTDVGSGSHTSEFSEGVTVR